jgi:hypothetical protein
MSKSSSRSNNENQEFSETSTEQEASSLADSNALPVRTLEVDAFTETAQLPSTSPAYIEEVTLPEKIKGYKDTIYSIAILLTGSIEDAEAVVDEVFDKISYNLTELSHENIEGIIHSYTYDSSLCKLLHQVDERAADLEETGAKIMKLPTYLC